ncbi:MAG: hypothetical protein M3S32_06425 [Acidobacteriota bacterium]|nr:hypothetical protein [Acidobacteriota bacterium]
MLLPPWSHVRPAIRYNANLNDAATQMAPWAKAARMAWKEGSLPLRNRWNGLGMPLASNGQSAPFSPFSILMMPVPLAAGFTLAAAAKILLALSGMMLWLRELSVSRGSAAFGAVLFALSMTMTPWLLFPHTSVFCLWPWAALGIELLRDTVSRARARVLLITVFFVWPLCGHPESVVLGAMFLALWLAARALSGTLPDWIRLARDIGICALAALGLSAFLLLPQALAIGASNRIRVAEEFWRRLPLSWRPHGPKFSGTIVTSLFPRSFGDAIASPPIPGAAGSFPEMALGHFGLAGAAAALLILRPGGKRRPESLALLLPAAAGLAAAAALWPMFEIFLHLPGVRLMLPTRYLSWVAFAGPAAAAFEADRLRRDLAGRRGAAIVLLSVSVSLAIAAILVFRRLAPLHADAGGLASQKHALVLSLAALGATAAAALAAALSKTGARLLPLLLAAVAAIELGAQGSRLYRFGAPADLFPETPLIRFLQSRPGPFRAGGGGAVLFPNSNVFAGVEDIRTHDPVERRDYVDFLDRAARYPPAEYFKRLGDWNAPALDLLNLRYLAGEPGDAPPGPKWRLAYSGTDGVVFENTMALPRVFGAGRVALSSRGAADGFTISGYREGTNEISFRSSAPARAPAIVSVVQDGGWAASDEAGGDLPVSLAENLLIRLDLPAGDHRIRLRYRPPGFLAGCAVSALSAVCLGAAALTDRRRRRRQYSTASGSG